MAKKGSKSSIDIVTGLLVTVGLSGNAFFIKRLVDEVDRTKQLILQQQVSYFAQEQAIADAKSAIATINARLRIVIKEIPPRPGSALK